MINQAIYYCSTENNDCPQKEECHRYKELIRNNNSQSIVRTTLYKVREPTGCSLFIKDEENIDKGGEQL